MGELIDVGSEVGVKLVIGHTQNSGKLGIHRQVFQIVQSGKDAHFAELADAGEEDKAKVWIHRFENGVELFQP